jgi:hypothetical protein
VHTTHTKAAAAKTCLIEVKPVSRFKPVKGVQLVTNSEILNRLNGRGGRRGRGLRMEIQGKEWASNFSGKAAQGCCKIKMCATTVQRE